MDREISDVQQLPRLCVEHWNKLFAKGGAWEANGGREQTRLFAESFCKHSRIDRKAIRTVVDTSCALGDAMPIFHRHFMNARLLGLDFSEMANKRSKEEFSNIASFRVARIDEIAGQYDLIYSSATLEHFPDYKEKARTLLRHCRHLCILVPYNETRQGKDLECDPNHDHLVTFHKDSFDFLLEQNLAKRIFPPRIVDVPGAWSWTVRDRCVETFKNMARFLLRRPLSRNAKMVLFEIEGHLQITSTQSSKGEE